MPLGRSGAERQPATPGSHQHQSGDPIRLRLCHRDGRRAAKAVAQQVKPVDTDGVQRLEKRADRDLGDRLRVEVGLGGAVAAAEAGLIGQHDPESLGQRRQVLMIVTDPGGSRAAAVQHDQDGSLAGL